MATERCGNGRNGNHRRVILREPLRDSKPNPFLEKAVCRGPLGPFCVRSDGFRENVGNLSHQRSPTISCGCARPNSNNFHQLMFASEMFLLCSRAKGRLRPRAAPTNPLRPMNSHAIPLLTETGSGDDKIPRRQAGFIQAPAFRKMLLFRASSTPQVARKQGQ